MIFQKKITKMNVVIVTIKTPDFDRYERDQSSSVNVKVFSSMALATAFMNANNQAGAQYEFEQTIVDDNNFNHCVYIGSMID